MNINIGSLAENGHVSHLHGNTELEEAYTKVFNCIMPTGLQVI